MNDKGDCVKLKGEGMMAVLKGPREQYVNISDLEGTIPGADISKGSGVDKNLVSAIAASLHKISNQLNEITNLSKKIDKMVKHQHDAEEKSSANNSEVVSSTMTGGAKTKRSRMKKSRVKKSKKTLRHRRS